MDNRKTVILYVTKNYSKNKNMILAIQSFGFAVLAMSNVAHPEMKLADDYLVIPNHNIETILSLVKDRNIIVAMTATDHFSGKVGEINDRLDLPGLRHEPALELNDKFFFDEFLIRNNLPRLDTVFPTSLADIENLAYETLILKPTRSSGAYKSLEIEYEHWTKVELLRSNNISHQIMEINSHDPLKYSLHKKYGQLILQKSLERDYRWICLAGVMSNGVFSDTKLVECHTYPFPHNIGLKWHDAATYEHYPYLTDEEKIRISALTRKIIGLANLDNSYVQIEYAYFDNQFYPVDVALRFSDNEMSYPKVFLRSLAQLLAVEETISYEDSQNNNLVVLKAFLFSLKPGKIKHISYEDIEDVELIYGDALKPGSVIPKIIKSGTHEPFLMITGLNMEELFQKYHTWISNCKVEYYDL